MKPFKCILLYFFIQKASSVTLMVLSSCKFFPWRVESKSFKKHFSSFD